MEDKELLIKLCQTFTDLTNEYYTQSNLIHYKVALSNEFAAYFNANDNQITLGIKLLQFFGDNHLPRFNVFYHELGHVLYSTPYNKLICMWKDFGDTITPKFDKKYLHLMNWCCDFYIEDRIVSEYDYLEYTIKLLKKLPIEDELDITKAFNYYYRHGKPSPTLKNPILFMGYITRIMSIRSHPDFNTSYLTTILNSRLHPTLWKSYIVLIDEFYNYCVQEGIFKLNDILPVLPSPVLSVSIKSTNGTNTDEDKNNTEYDIENEDGDDEDDDDDVIYECYVDKTNSSIDQSHHGTITAYDKTVGKTFTYDIADGVSNREVFEMFKAEELTYKEGYTSESTTHTLDGLFTSEYVSSNTIGRPNIPNFFKPDKLVTQDLFLKRSRTFTNVSLYRDISGSTTGTIHRLMNHILLRLIDSLPIEYHHYLYASGVISIIECPFISWEDSDIIPSEYLSNELFQQLSGGTNSGAIADAIAEQYNEQWLNVIITDGDLYDLFRRDNINKLLDNIFVIFVCSENSLGNDYYFKNIKDDQMIVVSDDSMIDMIIPKLLKFGGA